MGKVAVVGLGYVGLPLALEASKAGYSVIGIDTNLKRVTDINQGKSHLLDINGEEILACLGTGRFLATSDYSEIRGASIVLICVPTPLNIDRKPDLTLLQEAAASIGEHLEKNTLIILESTVEPGTTRNLLTPLILAKSKITSDQIKVAFSPERVDPGNKIWNLNNTPKLISGLDENAVTLAKEFYKKFVVNIYECQSVEIAESAKLLENTYRYINIAFINEFTIFCNKLGISSLEAIDAASTKPYGYMPFYPSLGVGGHCIPVDSLYLLNKARDLGISFQSILTADNINNNMPNYFLDKVENKLGDIINKKILVIGVAYKPNVADTRETPASNLIESLRNKGAIVSWHDELVQKWNGEVSTQISPRFDFAIIVTPHSYIDLSKLGSVPIINTRGENF
jgi:UDP-N-acetyl-D-glucosamine dehydrogenase